MTKLVFSKIWIPVILIILVAGGVLAWQYFGMPKEEVKVPEEKTQEEIVKNETADWQIYRNEEYKIEFKHPKEWISLTLESQKTDDVYIFKSANELIEEVYYHKPSGIIAFATKGKRHRVLPKDEPRLKEPYVYDRFLKIIYPSKEIKNIYGNEIVQFRDDLASFAHEIYITRINLSPNGRYVYFLVLGYEYAEGMLIEIATGRNIIKNYDIWFNNPYEDIYWSPNNQVLVINSEVYEFGGYGTEGIFISDYGKPERLNEVFAFGPIFEERKDRYISDILIDNDKLSFSVFLITEWEVKEGRYTGKYTSEEKEKYEYIFRTKDLRKIK